MTRSQMLKQIMPLLSGGNGDKIAEVLEKGNPEDFMSVWIETGKKLITKSTASTMENQKMLPQKSKIKLSPRKAQPRSAVATFTNVDAYFKSISSAPALARTKTPEKLQQQIKLFDERIARTKARYNLLKQQLTDKAGGKNTDAMRQQLEVVKERIKDMIEKKMQFRKEYNEGLRGKVAASVQETSAFKALKTAIMRVEASIAKYEALAAA